MDFIDKQVIFGIVIYNQKYWESDSFTSLVKSYREFDTKVPLYIYIFDNTEKTVTDLIEFNDKKIFINYYGSNVNYGVSKAYNSIYEYAIKLNFKWIVLLDQDTQLPNNFYEIYTEKAYRNETNESPIAAPLIYSQKKLISPSKIFNHRAIMLKKVNSNFINLKNLSCINTGLMIKTVFFRDIGGYNEKIKLDFCDRDFINKIRKKLNELEILNIKLNQDLSFVTDNKNKALFRYSIFIRDYKVYSSDKNKIILFVFMDLPHLLKLSFKYKTIEFIKMRLISKN